MPSDPLLIRKICSPARWAWRLVLLCLMWMYLSASATAIPAALDLATVTDKVSLSASLMQLQDNDATLDLDAAMASPDWHPVIPASWNLGYTASTIWLRASLYNSGNEKITRWIAVGSPRLEEVTYYRLAADQRPGQKTGVPQQVVRAGNREPISNRSVIATLPVFPVTLAAGQRTTIVVRISSRSAIDIDATLWEPDAFRQAESIDLQLNLILYGPLLLMVIYTLIQGLVRRDRTFTLLAIWITLTLAYNIAYRGYLYRFFLSDGDDWLVRIPATLGTAMTIAYVMASIHFVSLQRVPFWRRAYCIVIALLILGCLWCALGDYRAGAVYANSMVFITYGVWALSMLDGWRRRLKNARLMLLSFGALSILGTLRIFQLHAWLLNDIVSEKVMEWLTSFSFLLLLVLLTGKRTMEVHQQQLAAQQALLDAQEQEQTRLEQAVSERTGELVTALAVADDANRTRTLFLARISHDLRTPLTSIIGFAELVQAAGREDAERGAIIRRSAAHLLTMVNDLIDYAAGANPDTLHVVPVYVHALFDAIAHEADRICHDKGNKFTLTVSTQLPPVLQLDDKRIRQMLANLIDNANKFTEHGSISLDIACSRQHGSDLPLILHLRVSDTGCGINAADQARIFEPFVRLDSARNRSGVGLGLAIVRQWITCMNGTLQIDSHPGQGTNVTMSLPVLHAGEADITHRQRSDNSEMLPLIDGAGRRIWIVEDTDEILDFLTDGLESLGFVVESETSGDAMLARIAQLNNDVSAAPDLFITDQMMPGASGREVLAAAHRHCPGIPVVAISATPLMPAAAPLQGTMQEPGYAAFLLKPVSLLTLGNTLARLLDLPQVLPQALPANVAAAVPMATAAASRPTPQQLHQVRQLIALGAVSDLEDWFEDLAATDPGCQAFAMTGSQLARRGNLKALAQLCDGDAGSNSNSSSG